MDSQTDDELVFRAGDAHCFLRERDNRGTGLLYWGQTVDIREWS